jgi:hypothetical protein
MLKEWSTSSSNVPRCSRVRQVFASKACRSSWMIGHAMTESDMVSVVRNLKSLTHPWVRSSMRVLIKSLVFRIVRMVDPPCDGFTRTNSNRWVSNVYFRGFSLNWTGGCELSRTLNYAFRKGLFKRVPTILECCRVMQKLLIEHAKWSHTAKGLVSA